MAENQDHVQFLTPYDLGTEEFVASASANFL